MAEDKIHQMIDQEMLIITISKSHEGVNYIQQQDRIMVGVKLDARESPFAHWNRQKRGREIKI